MGIIGELTKSGRRWSWSLRCRSTCWGFEVRSLRESHTKTAAIKEAQQWVDVMMVKIPRVEIQWKKK